MPEETKSMESNKGIQINWGAFNVPTLIAVGTVLWYTATSNEQQNSRITATETSIDQINTSRLARNAEINKSIEGMSLKIAPIDNMQYRLTLAESGVADTNRRIDRQTDTMQGFRENVGDLVTQIALLRQVIEQAFPEKAALLSSTPKELVK